MPSSLATNAAGQAMLNGFRMIRRCRSASVRCVDVDTAPFGIIRPPPMNPGQITRTTQLDANERSE